MNKKKSKCCCIYVKPRQFGESSSESDDECEHCYGHVEQKGKHSSETIQDQPGPSNEPGASKGPGNDRNNGHDGNQPVDD